MGECGWLTIPKTFFDEGTLEGTVDIVYRTDMPKGEPLLVRVAGKMVENDYFSQAEHRKFEKAVKTVKARDNSYRLESDRDRNTQIWVLGLGNLNTAVRHIRYVQQ